LLAGLSFGPAWARRDPAAGAVPARAYREEPQADERPRRGGGRERFADAGRRRERPALRREAGRRPALRDADLPPRPAAAPLPPLRLALVPDPQQLSALVRQLRAARKAYPLPNLAALLTSKPEYCWVKIEAADGEQRTPLHGCRLCRAAVALDRATLLQHAVRAHLEQFFSKQETETEPPAGQFVCVARCGLSGALLGPPNHHSFAEKLQELHQTRFPGMPLDEYRRHVEMRREPELIEQWREQARKQTVYQARETAGPEAPAGPLSRSAAEAFFLAHLAPAQVTTSARALLPLAPALQMEDRRLRQAVQELWQREVRSPRSLLFAIRAAFRHKKLHLFRVGGNREYITDVEPSALDPTHAVPLIGEILRYLQAHPGARREEVTAALRPEAAADSAAARECAAQLAWLIDKGHIVEFFDGALIDARLCLGATESRPARPAAAQ